MILVGLFIASFGGVIILGYTVGRPKVITSLIALPLLIQASIFGAIRFSRAARGTFCRDRQLTREGETLAFFVSVFSYACAGFFVFLAAVAD
jgi:hypothetical protein